MVPPPRRSTDPLQLADWLELRAILAPDHNSSRGDLISFLQTASVADRQDLEPITLATFRELEFRRIAAGAAYPFDLSGPLLAANANWKTGSVPYVFCLVLSYWGVRPAGRLHPATLFETISTYTAANYVAGNAEKFGSPRRTLPAAFRKAVDRVCQLTGEGEKFNDRGWPRTAKDDGLDIIAWRAFADGLPGKTLVFGQCASGGGWTQKTTELDPEEFCKKWYLNQPFVYPVKAFFTPHRVGRSDWDRIGYEAGVVFDRCRISMFAPIAETYEGQLRWTSVVLDGWR